MIQGLFIGLAILLCIYVAVELGWGGGDPNFDSRRPVKHPPHRIKGCQYPANELGTARCGAPTVLYERYCAHHIKHVHQRTNIFNEKMPDHPEAPWINPKPPVD